MNSARDTVVRSDITVHGLVIACSKSERPTSGNRRHRTQEIYFAPVIIASAGTFFFVAGDDLCFAQAVRRELILEIAKDGPTGPPRKIAPAVK